MSKKTENPDSIYTQQVKQLIDLVYPQEAGLGSVYEDARHFFTLTPELESHITELKDKLVEIEGGGKRKQAHEEQLRKKLKVAEKKLEDERLARLDRLDSVALKLLTLCEGDTWQETQHLSAKFLGTVMLLTRGPQGNFARHHQRLKPLYKAVLCLRLTDKVLAHEKITHPYLSRYQGALERFEGSRKWQDTWREELALPLIKACVLQDIGLQSSEAIAILRGDEGDKDEFRVLEGDDRKQLLKINYYQSLRYIKEGLGLPAYIGNDKEERDRFNAMHEAASAFTMNTVKDAFVGKSGIGEIIKIPQIYVSIVLSTKPDYTRKELPKGYMLIEQLAKKEALNPRLAGDFIKIVGYFPQGFGVTFIPKNERGIERDQYECAIVTGLNPKNPAEPMCRVVSRNLTYISAGQDDVIERSCNLYFPANRKKLMRIGRERLTEIMDKLSANFTPDAIDDLVPSYWEPFDYFLFKKHQNLWNRY
ncbi:hypothetical protein [Alteromonas halophila]|uniref:hypothetical protein n=1 Tax=Alteromonas halophila TaxID=516698 RepID=UPI001677E6B9|nr:hypothetical protein [Alteromonas halophila]